VGMSGVQEGRVLIKPQDIYIKCSEDLSIFSQWIFGELMSCGIPDFHREMYGMLPAYRRIVLAAPRGFAKSSLSSIFYPTWLGLFKKKKDICLISASESLAVELLRKIKIELEGNQRILGWFGDVRSPKWTENHIILKNGVNIRAKGAGGQIRGFRPDCLILDDIETDESVLSEEQRKKLKDWLFRACLNTLLPEGQMFVIGTIIHPLSVLSDLLETDNGWEKRKYQAYINERQEKGHELWPEMWPHEKLQERKREIGSFAFASEYLNNPVADESAPIKPGQIRTWKEMPLQYSSVIVIDPAYTEDERLDFKVASHIAIDQQHNRYLVSYVRTHNPTGNFIDSILNMYLQNKGTVTGVGVPTGGTEKEFFRTLTNKAAERHLGVPFIELTNSFTTATGITKRNKKERIIASLQPLFESGRYYLHANHHEARDELLSIGSSRWDDIVDTMAYAEQILTPMYFEPAKTGFNQPPLMQGRSVDYGIEY